AAGTPHAGGAEAPECESRTNTFNRRGDDPAAAPGLQRPPVVQAKFTVGASNDPLEQEADRSADRSLAAPACPTGHGIRPSIQRMAMHTTPQTLTAPPSVDRVL